MADEDFVINLEGMLDNVLYKLFSEEALERLKKASRTNARDLYFRLRQGASDLKVSTLTQVLQWMEKEGTIQQTKDAEYYLKLYRSTSQYRDDEIEQFRFYELKK